jgi:radical SAM superfamily enzyme YgiQ (UPF0313 family)
MVQIGIEASNDEQRDELNKQLGTQTVEEAVRLLRENDIVCQGMFIVGLPSDSPDTVEQKVRLVNRLDVDFPVFVIYTLFPGAPAYDEAMEQGLIEQPPNYAHHDMAHVVVPPTQMTPHQVYSYTRWAFTAVYLHPVKLARILFTRNHWRRQNWGGMLAYMGRQIARNLVPRVR